MTNQNENNKEFTEQAGINPRHNKASDGHCNTSLSTSMSLCYFSGVRYSSVVRAFAHGAMGRQIDPSWG